MNVTVKFETVERIKPLAPLGGNTVPLVRVVMENGNSVVIPEAWIVEVE